MMSVDYRFHSLLYFWGNLLQTSTLSLSRKLTTIVRHLMLLFFSDKSAHEFMTADYKIWNTHGDAFVAFFPPTMDSSE